LGAFPQVRGCLWSGAGSNRRPSAFQVNRAKRCADLRKRTSPTSETAQGGRCKIHASNVCYSLSTRQDSALPEPRSKGWCPRSEPHLTYMTLVNMTADRLPCRFAATGHCRTCPRWATAGKLVLSCSSWQFVLQVHGPCSLSSSYSYVYEMADWGWRRMPNCMSAEGAAKAVERVAAHTTRHDLPNVDIVSHGEPLLAGAQWP
jgi:hypothetical protein